MLYMHNTTYRRDFIYSNLKKSVRTAKNIIIEKTGYASHTEDNLHHNKRLGSKGNSNPEVSEKTLCLRQVNVTV
jgi:hypothetical protein